MEEGLGILIRHVADETGRINCSCADRKVGIMLYLTC